MSKQIIQILLHVFSSLSVTEAIKKDGGFSTLKHFSFYLSIYTQTSVIDRMHLNLVLRPFEFSGSVDLGLELLASFCSEGLHMYTWAYIH